MTIFIFLFVLLSTVYVFWWFKTQNGTEEKDSAPMTEKQTAEAVQHIEKIIADGNVDARTEPERKLESTPETPGQINNEIPSPKSESKDIIEAAPKRGGKR